MSDPAIVSTVHALLADGMPVHGHVSDDHVRALLARITHLTAAIAHMEAENAALTAGNATATGNDWELAAALLSGAGHDHLAGCVYQLARHIDRLRAAIATHHATRWTAGRAVLSPPDRALYDAAGEAYRVLDWDAGGDTTTAKETPDV